MKNLFTIIALVLGLCAPAYAGGLDFGPKANANAYANGGNAYAKGGSARQHQGQAQGQQQGQAQGQGQQQKTNVNNSDTNIYNEKRQTGAIANAIACENGVGIGGAVPGGSGLISACWTPKYKRDIERQQHDIDLAAVLASASGSKADQVFLTHIANQIPEARQTLEAVGMIQRETIGVSTRGKTRHATQQKPVAGHDR